MGRARPHGTPSPTQPSGTCQACLSDKSPDKDFMITCDLCQSSIHYKHYGREIDESQQATYDKWRCERCRVLCQLASQGKGGEVELPRCHFCPSSKGILKRVVYNGSETIWLHPECSTWPYPIIYQKNNRRIHYNCEYPIRPTGRFWVNFQGQEAAACTICNQTVGYKIKVTPSPRSACTILARSTTTAAAPRQWASSATWKACSTSHRIQLRKLRHLHPALLRGASREEDLGLRGQGQEVQRAQG